MTLNIKAATLAFSLLSATLLGVYIANNLIKVTWSAKKLGVIAHSNPVKVLEIWQGNQVTASFSLPTSDLFDSSGKRQINFKYISQKRLEELTKNLHKAQMQVDGVSSKVALARYTNALSLTLPDKKLFLVAPPHMQTTAQLLRHERSQWPDVFLCGGDDAFCDSVKLTDFGGLTKLKGARLKEDSFFNGVIAPYGRWLGRSLVLEFITQIPRSIVVTLQIETPFSDQKVLVQGANKPKYHLQREESEAFLKPIQLSVLLPLNADENQVKIMFSKLLKASAAIPYDTAGVLTQLIYRPYKEE